MRKGLSIEELGDLLERPFNATLATYRRDGTFLLSIADNGVGFDPATVRRGHGLVNISARTEALGGTLQILGRDAGGTCHRVTVPLPGKTMNS